MHFITKVHWCSWDSLDIACMQHANYATYLRHKTKNLNIICPQRLLRYRFRAPWPWIVFHWQMFDWMAHQNASVEMPPMRGGAQVALSPAGPSLCNPRLHNTQPVERATWGTIPISSPRSSIRAPWRIWRLSTWVFLTFLVPETGPCVILLGS